MAKKAPATVSVSQAQTFRSLARALKTRISDYWRQNWWHKTWMIVAALVVVAVAGMYGIARWYIWSQRDKPLEMGLSFIPDYARSLGLDPKETMDAMTDDLGVKRFRLVSYWSNIERSPGHYDFSELDWQFEKANAADAKVSLAIGLRQPRWPECHMPEWAAKEPMSVWAPQLKDFIKATVDRYGKDPALASYQLENEYFLSVFGECPDFSRGRLVDEFNYVKHLDSDTPVIVTRSNNALGTPIYAPDPDEYGVSVYKRVWDTTLTKRYVEYPFPAWFYAFLGGTSKIIKHRDTFIHELQAEPWPPHGQSIVATPLEEQDKSTNAERLRNRFEYGKATGMKQIDLWGAEWWYWRKTKGHDSSLWDVARDEYSKANAGVN